MNANYSKSGARQTCQLEQAMTVQEFRKILVANRGEIAVRVIRACREMGIGSVAVYSDVDRNSLHVRLADKAVHIGQSPPSLSYLNQERIIQAALDSGAEAIHPGYGLLSENVTFAQAVEDAGLVFIGPPSRAIASMGDKGAARQVMESADVPVIPGYHGPDDEAAFLQAAEELGYPVLVKAVAGGGGKGMRLAWSPNELPAAMAAARREAQHAFDEDRLILEAFIPQARHIEFQILADKFGNTVHLFERDCSTQRRHQKIVEETPAKILDPALRAEMGGIAVKAAKAVGYINAGTVEFVFDPARRHYYFLEMNTRIQVEHPITELVAGIDLVQWQIRIAAGQQIPFNQEDIYQRGHALECRLYAEDPEHQFLPAGGRLLDFRAPIGPGIRLDSGYASGDEIPIDYDPLIAKIIVHAEDRDQALSRMLSAIHETVILGLPTNQAFLADLISSEAFRKGQVHTTWVEETFINQHELAPELPPEVIITAALIERFRTQADPAGKTAFARDPFNPWKLDDHFRSGRSA